MNDKRRGLGRGLGALIPNTTEPTRVTRPTDVFFTDSNASRTQDGDEPSAPEARASRFSEALTPRPSHQAPRGTEPRTESRASTHRRHDDLAAAAAAVTQPAGQAPSVSRETEVAKLEAQPEQRDDAAGIDDERDVTSNLAPVPGASFAEIPQSLIRPNPKQPRSVFDEEHMAELVHSIGEIGVLQPIVVRPVPEGDPDHAQTPYELIMGERRWRASQEAGLATVPAIVRSTTDEDLLCDALLVDQISRSDTYPYVDIREDDVSMGHEASVSKVSEDQLFYLMSRGMEEDEAMAMIVRGFVEPIAKELPMEYALELNRLIELQMEGAVG